MWRFRLVALVFISGLALSFVPLQKVSAAALNISAFSPKAGSGGRAVKIKGSGFTGATAVKFNGTSVSSFVVSKDSQIQTSVPLLASTGKISVTVGGSTVNSSSDFVIEAPARPYVRINGDVFTGGWFDTGYVNRNQNGQPAGACQVDTQPDGTTDLYQSPGTFTDTYPGSSVFKGGVFGYQKNDNRGFPVGSAADFGIWSLGLLQANKDNNTGFASGQTGRQADTKLAQRLTFANTGTNTPNTPNFYKPTDFGGGLFAGADNKTFCIPDYEVIKKDNPKDWTGTSDLGSAKSGQYQAVNTVGSYSGGTVLTLNSDKITISQNRNITLFVQGDVYIGDDIVYPGNTNTFSTPHFALVARGNIYIGGDVTKLNGLYIAEPSPDDDNTGIIWTCHKNSIYRYTGDEAYDHCKKPLTISGGLIAKQVNFLRVGGDIGDPTVTAETINYPSENITGGPYFNSSSGDGKMKIESIVSLPPIF